MVLRCARARHRVLGSDRRVTLPRVSSTAVALVALSLGACSGSNDLPPDTVGVVPVVSDAGTLLPVLADTLPPDVSVTIAPDTLFNGDPCSALMAGDFRSVTIAGTGTGVLTGFNLLSDDTCSYDVRAGGSDYQVFVQAASADEFDHPVTTAQEIDKFANLGEEAIGVARGDDRYEVIVRVANGFFSVTTPDKASARALAAKAAERA